MMLLLEDLGLAVIRLFDFFGKLIFLIFDTLVWIARGAIRVKLTLEQMSILGVNSLSIIIITTGFAGMVISLELAQIAVRYGVGGMAGGGVALAMFREFGPMLTAVVAAGRVGSAIAAELGSMRVTEQIDALEAMAVPPTKYLVVPRFLACCFMMPILTLFGNTSGILGGSFAANYLAGIPYKIFFDSISNMTVPNDLIGGLIKALIFGAEISIISCFQGMNTSGGAAGVGRATTSSVVLSIIIIFISNYFLTAWLFS